jgi:CubicO group peptidase (beta-lactamase class C family)
MSPPIRGPSSPPTCTGAGSSTCGQVKGWPRTHSPGTYSAIKGATHLTVALVVQDGVLELDRKVADHWPEFAAGGKGQLTVRQLLAHRSGAIGVDGGFTIDELADDRLIAARLASQKPYWAPGTTTATTRSSSLRSWARSSAG